MCDSYIYIYGWVCMGMEKEGEGFWGILSIEDCGRGFFVKGKP